MMEQSYYTNQTSDVSDEAKNALGEAASEFSKNIQDATGKLVSAAEQFSAMSEGLTKAVAEAKEASARAEEAREAAESVKARMDHDYSNLSGLMRDLQERIGALAVLARPLASVESEPSASIAEASENSGEAESSDASHENAPSPAGWQGWQG
jgi:chromosome segregation ATPase